MDTLSVDFIGCCGAYCRTCKAFKEKVCRGCKIGYPDERNLLRAKCKIKVCCITKKYISCADCENYDKCEIIQDFHNKDGHKYKKYREAIIFIMNNGYEKFIRIANEWKIQYGKYKS